MSEAVIVGVTGYARSGKDTVAQLLTDEFGFVKRSFADSLREHIYDLNPIIAWQQACDDPTTTVAVRYQDAINHHGYETAKGQYTEIRALLQRYGTEVWRDRDPDIWIKQHEAWLADRPEVGLVVVPDVRFPNEAEHVDWLIRVNRPGVGPVNAHASDNQIHLLDADIEVENDGTVEDLWARLRPLFTTGAFTLKP